MRWSGLVCAIVGCGGSSSCPEPAGEPVAVGAVGAIGSDELSGLAASHTVDGLLWTLGDDGADLYSIDGATAAVHGTLHLADADAIDWEDVAVAPCALGSCIYVLDGGDNDLVRSTFAVFEVTEPTANPVGTRDVTWRRFELRYPDGPHDMEALFVDPSDGTSYGITKVEDGAATIYRLPRTAGAISTAIAIGTFTPPRGDTRVTAADLVRTDCGVRLGIRTHDRLFELRGAPATDVATLIAGEPDNVPVADEPQGEGFTYAADVSGYFTIGEGASPTLWRVDIQ